MRPRRDREVEALHAIPHSTSSSSQTASVFVALCVHRSFKWPFVVYKVVRTQETVSVTQMFLSRKRFCHVNVSFAGVPGRRRHRARSACRSAAAGTACTQTAPVCGRPRGCCSTQHPLHRHQHQHQHQHRHHHHQRCSGPRPPRGSGGSGRPLRARARSRLVCRCRARPAAQPDRTRTSRPACPHAHSPETNASVNCQLCFENNCKFNLRYFRQPRII